MAVFTENSDLSRQEQTIQRVGLKGNKKLLMNALGYNKHGEKTAWGKVMPLLGSGGFVGDMGARLVANKVAKGTSAGETMKASNQEYWAAKGSQLKFGIEAAKLSAQVAAGAAGGGGGAAGSAGALGSAGGAGALGGAGSAGGAGALGSGSTSLATPPISGASSAGGASGAGGAGGGLSSVLSGGGDISSVGGDVSSAMSGGNNVLDMPTSGGLGGEALPEMNPDMGAEPYKGAMESDVGQKVEELKADSAVKDTEDLLKEEVKKKAKEEKGESDKLDKNLKKGLDMANKAMPIIGAGVDWYQKSRAVEKEEDRIKKKQLSRTVMADYNLL